MEPAAAPACAPRVTATQHRRSLGSLILLSFVVTFLVSRCMVLLIMSRAIPSLYLHVGGTHVHHLNYGIFILAAVGGALFLVPLHHRALAGAAVLYGIGLALTFDEFGMWLHLGGPYWQRASFDAVVTIASILGLYCLAPAITSFTRKHWLAAAFLAVIFIWFTIVLVDSMRFAGRKFSPYFEQIEALSPP